MNDVLTLVSSLKTGDFINNLKVRQRKMLKKIVRHLVKSLGGAEENINDHNVPDNIN
ncbi:unannotated protein [freshwater metagenome]|uniref:Unannotated protein n=1 Tax=freshwater metagenome TaxID=449393 RepID=A0A6J6JL38_9ZZZZ